MRVLCLLHLARQQASSSGTLIWKSPETWFHPRSRHCKKKGPLIQSWSFPPDIVSYVYFSYVHQNWIRTFPPEVDKYISITDRSRAIILRRHTVPIAHAQLLLKAQHTPWLVQRCSNNHCTTLSKHPQTLPMIRSIKQQNSAPCRAFVK